jgi:hypothetical protein
VSDEIKIRIDDDDGGSSSAARQPAKPATANEHNSEAERRRVYAERAHLERQMLQARYQAVTAQCAEAEAEAQTAELESRTAYENGDTAGMAAAQRKIARAEARALRADEAKAALENAHAYRSSTLSDPVEAYAQGRTHRSADWIRRHPDYITDARKNAKLQSAHHDALAEGLSLDSDDYFAHIEKTIGLRDGSPAQRASRASGDPLPPNAVRMSKREYELATDGTLTWERGPNRGKPLGVREYLRRRQITDNAPEWQRLPS